MNCLNLPLKARSSSNAIRIISATPPGVDIAEVFKIIQRDIVIGMTEGFVDYDADGRRRRIFLDLVGFIGDTPALNGVLDVLGHTSVSCCHLCRVSRRSATLVGIRYTRPGFHSAKSSLRRDFYQHMAVRDSCGIRPPHDNRALPLHALRKEMAAVRHRIPTTKNGIPILSGYLDPYRAYYVAPDHLLTGHTRDCINLAFKLLPSSRHRRYCESFMIGFLVDALMPAQQRLFDHDRKQLYSMSMTKIYALSVVAQLGFLHGYAQAEAEASQKTTLTDRCKSAIAMVGSCAQLVSRLSFLPDTERDGPCATALFNMDNGLHQIAELQQLVDVHLVQIQKLCSMSDLDFNLLNGSKCGKLKKSQLSREHDACLLAIKTIDKPNIHRLRELVYSTVLMVGHVSRIGELVLEKTHQSLKRGIRQSKDKQSHLQSLSGVLLNDWQRRLSLLSPGALQGEESAVRGCLRLLAGREAVPNAQVTLHSDLIRQVQNALGPEACVPRLLSAQGVSVLSFRAMAPRVSSWTLEGSVESVKHGSEISTAERCRAYECFSQIPNFKHSLITVTLADKISSPAFYGINGTCFRRGQVLQPVCLMPKDLSFHKNLVVQLSNIDQTGTLSRQSGPSLWCAAFFFKVEIRYGQSQYFAAVLPCQELHRHDSHDRANLHLPRYTVMNHGGCSPPQCSFLRVKDTLPRAAVIHECDPGVCCAQQHLASLNHGFISSPLSGGTFYTVSRFDGYPPRQG